MRRRSALARLPLFLTLVLVVAAARRCRAGAELARARLRRSSLAAIALAPLLARSADALPPRGAVARSTPRCDARARRDERLPELEQIEREVALGTRDRLRPPLPPAADARAGSPPSCSRRAAASTSTASPDAARRALGDDAWEIVRADREPPRDRFAPGLDVAALRRGRRFAGGALMELAQVQEHATRILDEVERAVVGKRDALELVLLGLLADGHVLLEDYPGLAKTLAARSFAQVTSIGFKRIQFTPDLMPSDVTGSSIWNQRDADFEFRPGPIFTNLLLADEINRAPPKTQAALLEAMQERQVTIEGVTHPLARPFLVLATQNPIEYEGTYPLPEAQLDRFLLRVGVRLPEPSDEWEVLARRLERREDEVELEPVVDGADAARAAGGDRARPRRPRPSAATSSTLVAATRDAAARPRSARARAAASRCSSSRAARRRSPGRDFVTPDDVKAVAVPALAHRLMLKPELWVQRLPADDVVRELLESVPDAGCRRDGAGGGMTPSASPRVAAYAALAALFLLAALASGRPELAVARRAVRAPARARAAARAAARAPRLADARAASARSSRTSSTSSSSSPPSGRSSGSSCCSRCPDGLEVVSGASARCRCGSAGRTSGRSSCGSAACAGATTSSATSGCGRATGSGWSPGRRGSTGGPRCASTRCPRRCARSSHPLDAAVRGQPGRAAEGRRDRVRRPAPVRARRPRPLDQLARERPRAASSSSTSGTRSGTPT